MADIMLHFNLYKLTEKDGTPIKDRRTDKEQEVPVLRKAIQAGGPAGKAYCSAEGWRNGDPESANYGELYKVASTPPVTNPHTTPWDPPLRNDILECEKCTPISI
jgi:hypothetical protein